MGWARARLFYDGRDFEIDSLEESLAITIQKDLDKIELQKCMTIITAIINPTKVKEQADALTTMMFPEVGEDKESSMEKAKRILAEETKKVYTIRRTDSPKGLVKRAARHKV
jgi:hypothetical protein